MPLKINIPNTSWSEQSVSLGGIEYQFVFSFNGRDERWRLSILRQGTSVKAGVKLMENQLLLNRYTLTDFDHGDLFCVRLKKDNLPVGRENLGFGKPYEIVYFTNEELGV